VNPSDPFNAAQTQTIETICRILKNDSDPSVRLTAAQELGNLSFINQTCIDALCQSAELDPDPEIRKQALKSLSKVYTNKITRQQLFQLLQTMSDQPKVQMNFNAPVTGVEGNFIVNAPDQNLAETVAEIQQLLNQLATTYPSTYLYEFEQQIPTNTRIRDSLVAGGIELLKILCPAAGIPIEMGMKWLETAKGQ
jgi:HEAT repeats